MSKALITGSEGFVGKYLRAELEGAGYEVTGLDRVSGPGCRQCDLLDAEGLANVLREIRPDAIFHLAGQANVWKSWKMPAETMEINAVGTIRLLEAVRNECPEAAVLLVGSSDQYGFLGERGVNVTEDMETRPQSPYAISKRAQEEMGMLYAKSYGMRVIATRSFNHGGAGQGEGFMIPDFAAGIARVEAGQQKCLRVGNLEAKRDFTHVKDVVRAYRLLCEKGQGGTVYNVGSGQTHVVRDVLEKLIAMAEKPVPVEQDPARMRPSDTPEIKCDNTRLKRDTGWTPEYSMDDILRDTLEWYRKKIRE